VWPNESQVIKRCKNDRYLQKTEDSTFSWPVLPNAKQAMKNAYKSNSKEQLLEKLNLLRQS
jgi:hypothetical protein